VNPLVRELQGKFLATGVGSLPHAEAPTAVRDVFDILGNHIPFWPQLPRRSFYENMYVQFAGRLPGLVVDEAGKSIRVVADGDQYLADLEDCFVKIQEADAAAFAIERSTAEGLYLFVDELRKKSGAGWVKAQLIGPLSLGLTLLDEAKKPILYHADLRQILAPMLALEAAWLAGQLRSHRKRAIIFIDEPYLVAVGTSACSLPRQEIVAMIDRVVEAIHDAGALAGLHCCGNTDWDLVLSTDIDILNFDAWEYLDKLMLHASALKDFLKKGGVPAIGIVPNTEIVKEPGTEKKILSLLSGHRALWENGALITTSCGCSGLTEALSRAAHEMAARVAERLAAGRV
jgi:hypothetical protein